MQFHKLYKPSVHGKHQALRQHQPVSVVRKQVLHVGIPAGLSNGICCDVRQYHESADTQHATLTCCITHQERQSHPLSTLMTSLTILKLNLCQIHLSALIITVLYLHFSHHVADYSAPQKTDIDQNAFILTVMRVEIVSFKMLKYVSASSFDVSRCLTHGP